MTPRANIHRVHIHPWGTRPGWRRQPSAARTCTTCDGTGYLVGQTYGYADPPDDWVLIQRCDTCEQWAGDDDAAAAYAATLTPPGIVAYWYGQPHDDRDQAPGDYAVRPAEEPTP